MKDSNDQQISTTTNFRKTLSDQIVDDYWSHIELQTEGCVLDWYKAYWRLAMMILDKDERAYIKRMTSMTPELLQKIISDYESKI